MLNDSNQNSHRVKGHACSFLSLSENHGKPGGKESRKEEGGSGQAWGPPPHLLFHTSPGGHGCMPIVKQRPRRLFGTGICQARKTLRC